MPRYLKDTKLGYFKIGEGYTDDEGIWHPGAPYKVSDLWGNFKGKDFTEFYAAHAVWAEPVFVATFTRPSFDVELGDYIEHDGKFYKIKSIDDLTGRPHTDMKATCQYDLREQGEFYGL